MEDLKKDIYVCYSTRQFDYIYRVKSINYIITGIHVKTKQQFWTFKRDEALNNALASYK